MGDEKPAAQPKGQSSLSTVFSLWNTMIGSTVVTIPWAMEQAGIVLGLRMHYVVVILGVGIIAFYTCSIIVKLGFSMKLYDTSDLIYAMWGKWGQRITVLMSAVLLLGALMAYNVILNSSFYLILDALSIWISGDAIGCGSCWNEFSSRYTPLILMGMLVALLNIKQKKTYIRFNSKGVYFVITTVTFLCAVGIRALCINHWTTHGSSHM